MLPLHMKAKVLKCFAYYKATSRASVRERRYTDKSKYFGWLDLVRGLVAGWSEQGEEMLKLPASPVGVFLTSIQCMWCLNIRILPVFLGLSVHFAIFIFHIIWKLKLHIYQLETWTAGLCTSYFLRERWMYMVHGTYSAFPEIILYK